MLPQVTDYLPRLGLLPLSFPRTVEQLLEYTFKMSAALALINMAPVIHLDGQAALDVLLDCLGAPRVPLVLAFEGERRAPWCPGSMLQDPCLQWEMKCP